MIDVIALILGGGRGERLYPLTLERAKPAVGFAGKYRLIDIPISNCINSGVEKIFVLTQFLGTIPALFQANLDLARPDPPFPLYAPRWPFYTRPRFLAPSRIVRSEIRDSLIADGADVSGAAINDSVLGMRGIVRENTRLKEVVFLGPDFYEGERVVTPFEKPGKDDPPLGIGKGCTIERAIIDKNARIGDGVSIRSRPEVRDFESHNCWVRGGNYGYSQGCGHSPGHGTLTSRVEPARKEAVCVKSCKHR